MNVDFSKHGYANVNFDPDLSDRKVSIKSYNNYPRDAEFPWHSHRKHQLVVPIQGSMTCKVEDGIWMVPTQFAFWIPCELMHVNSSTDNAKFYFVYFGPEVSGMLDHCCTLSLTPLVLELIRHLASQDQLIKADEDTDRIMDVLIQQLSLMRIEQLNFPIPTERRLNKIACMLMAAPADRRTVGQWANHVAMSERTLTRLVVQETGMTFGRWRQQLHIIRSLQYLSSGASVQSTAEDLGYESVSAFITMFKKALGKSPRQYVNESQKQK